MLSDELAPLPDSAQFIQLRIGSPARARAGSLRLLRFPQNVTNRK
jgi:hypothetical protein